MSAPLSPHDGLDATTNEVEKGGDEEIISGLRDSTASEPDLEESLKPILFSQDCLNDLIIGPNPAQSKGKIACIGIRRKQPASERC